MNDELTNSAERLFSDLANAEVLRAAEAGIWPATLWKAVADGGFTAALLPEEAGGFGITASEAMELVRVASAHAAPIPLGETMLAARLLAQAGLAVPEGPLSLAPVRSGDSFEASRTGKGWKIVGRASRIPWGRQAAAIVVLAKTANEQMLAACLPAGSFNASASANVASEPRDTIIADTILAEDDVAPVDFDQHQLRAAGAVLRTNQIAGAISRALALTVDYAQTRVQFGRPIGKFQAVQQALAVFAEDAAAVNCAGQAAAAALDRGEAFVEVAAAKLRANQAAGAGAAVAHQVHGAIGFTQAHGLHRLTRRLIAWRSEFGGDRVWAERLGAWAASLGAEGLWPELTRRSDH
jgi:acyl-CoA dehydrogenase